MLNRQIANQAVGSHFLSGARLFNDWHLAAAAGRGVNLLRVARRVFAHTSRGGVMKRSLMPMLVLSAAITFSVVAEAQDVNATCLPDATCMCNSGFVGDGQVCAACDGGQWQHLFTTSREILNAGLGLRAPGATGQYGFFLNPQGSVTLPRCPDVAGVVRVPVLTVDWEDYDPERDQSFEGNGRVRPLGGGYDRSTPEELQAFLNDPAGPGQYFRDVSGGKVAVFFDVIGWIRSDAPGSYLQPRANYITGTAPNLRCDTKAIFLDATRDAVASGAMNLTNYDADHNRVLDGAVMMYEGQWGLCGQNDVNSISGASYGATPRGLNFLHARDLVDPADPNRPTFAGQDIYVEYSVNIAEKKSRVNFDERPQNDPFDERGEWTHSLSQLLLGNADYGADDTARRFNLAAWGLTGAHTEEPTHPAAFEKWLFGRWIDASPIAASGTYNVLANEIPDGSAYSGTYIHVINIDGDPNRFLTIENRWFDDAGNTTTQWARAYGRESGLLIVEINLSVAYSAELPQLFRHVPDRAAPKADRRTFRPGDTFSQCYATQCISITPISDPGGSVDFSVAITPVEG